MGVFEQFPYANMHEMNLEWLLKKMKELDAAMETFKASESLKFADPIIWDITTQYEKSTIVLNPSGNAYLSLQPVPTGIQLSNDEYWLEIFNFTDYTRTANRNLTVNVETNTTRASAAYQVDDWLIWEDVLYRVTSEIAIDDAFIVAPAAGSNIIHFTVEDFIKAWISYANGLIQAYKDDIDASELAYRQQLAQDITTTTQSLQAQLNLAISGATVDSEVINARLGADGVTYSTLGEAIRTQIGDIDKRLDVIDYNNRFTTDSNVYFNVPFDSVLYKNGERYISKDYIINAPAGDEFLMWIGAIYNNSGQSSVRLEWLDNTDTTISGTSFNAGVYHVVAPTGTDKIKIQLIALSRQYATADGIVSFKDIKLTSYSYGKTPDWKNGYINGNSGYPVFVDNRRFSYFFKDKVSVLRTSSAGYAYVDVYDDMDYSSWTGEHYEVTDYSKVVEVVREGKYLTISLTGTIDTTFINYDEQFEKTSSDLDAIIKPNTRCLKFMWITDTHNNYRDEAVYDSLIRAREDMRFCSRFIKTDFLLHTGDLVAQSAAEYLSEDAQIKLMSKELIEFGKIGKLVYAVGNHDGETVNTDYANTTLYSIGYDFKNKGNQYYYFDNDGLKIRLIVLANPDNNYYGLSKNQLEWLANDALNTNYNIVCAMHINVNSNMYNLNRLADILNAYCDKTAGSGTVYGGGVISWDFTNSTDGKVLVMLGGHTHADVVYNALVSPNPFKFPVVILRKGCYSSELDDIAYSEQSYGYDIACLNMDDEKLYLYRRGHGTDRVVDL